MIEKTSNINDGDIRVILKDLRVTIKKIAINNNSNTITLIPLNSNLKHAAHVYGIIPDKIIIIDRVIQVVKFYLKISEVYLKKSRNYINLLC